MPSSEVVKVVNKSLERIEKMIDETYDFIYTDMDNKPMPLINMAVDKLYQLKEMEFYIKQIAN